MTREDVEEATKALARAIDALSADPPDVKRAATEITDAIAVIERVPNPYADRSLRPHLNFHQDQGHAEALGGTEPK